MAVNAGTLVESFSAIGSLPSMALNKLLALPAELYQARKQLERLTEPPLYWEMDSFNEQGINVPVYIAEAKDPVVEFHYCTGFNSTPLAYIPQIRVMNACGISVIASKLLHRDELGSPSPEELVKFHSDSARQFFSNPYIAQTNSGVVKILGTHSASGGHLANHMADEKTLAAICKRFPAAIHIAPFLDVANASDHFNPRIAKAFLKHATKHYDKKPSDTLKGRAYMAFHSALGEPSICSAIDEPTYGEILALKNQGLETIKKHQDLPWKPTLRQRFVTPTKDTASCHKTGTMYAQEVGGKITELKKTYHNPVLESSENLTRLINRLLMAQDLPAIPEGQHTIPKRPQITAEELAEKMKYAC
jgi:hypothetical protein